MRDLKVFREFSRAVQVHTGVPAPVWGIVLHPDLWNRLSEVLFLEHASVLYTDESPFELRADGCSQDAFYIEGVKYIKGEPQ